MSTSISSARSCTAPDSALKAGSERHAASSSRYVDIYISTVACMTAKIRRARGAAVDVVGLFVKVQPEIKDSFENLAAATGASKWALIEAMIEHAEQDLAAGRGNWLPTPESDQETLLSAQEVKQLKKSA